MTVRLCERCSGEGRIVRVDNVVVRCRRCHGEGLVSTLDNPETPGYPHVDNSE
jgi:DnaJ-class molecular chaperone